jgi:hypothetical protein
LSDIASTISGWLTASGIKRMPIRRVTNKKTFQLPLPVDTTLERYHSRCSVERGSGSSPHWLRSGMGEELGEECLV